MLSPAGNSRVCNAAASLEADASMPCNGVEEVTGKQHADRDKNASLEGGEQEDVQASGKRNRDVEGADDGQEARKKVKAHDEMGLRKVVLTGVKGLQMDVMRGSLERLGLPVRRFWKQTHNDTAEVWVPEDWAVVAGCCRVLDAQSVKGKTVHVDWVQGCEDVRPASTGEETQRPLVRQVTCLYDIEYEQQIVFKAAILSNSLRRVTLALEKEGSRDSKEGNGKTGSPAPWVRKAKRGPVVPLSCIHRSPTVRGYRNKNEFTIGYDTNGQPQVGFRYGRFMDGKSGVGCADDCPNVPVEALAIACCVKDFIVNHQKLDCWGMEKHSGFWRQLTVRHSLEGNLLVIVQYSGNNCERVELNDALVKLKDFLVRKAEEGEMKLSSLYGQEHNNVSNKAADDCPMHLIWGEECFYESLLGLKFRISPAAFFQVNTKAAEVLNALIRDWACASDDQVVLDVCCGTGTIGLCIASHAKQVVGIEMCEPAVRDAETNAKVNGIQNCVFMAGRAEAKIRDAIKQYVPEGGSCVAVVDPPREGLHPKVISVLRQTEAIERIVYVSCNHVNFIDQAVKLCSPVTAKYSGEPFEIVDANGVDLFPHTHHVELVALLERGATLAKRRAVEVDRESCCVGVREGEPRVSAQIDTEHHKAGAAAEALSVGQKVSTAVDGRADGQEVLT